MSNEIKKEDGTTVSILNVIESRVSTVADTGKPRPWYNHGDENSVAVQLGITWNQMQDMRKTPEWLEETKAYADANNVDIAYLPPAETRPGRNGLKKADYEEIGKDLVEKFVESASSNEEPDEEYTTTKEWVDVQFDGLKQVMDEQEFVSAARPVKPKKPVSAKAELESAKENAKARGLSQEDIEAIFGK